MTNFCSWKLARTRKVASFFRSAFGATTTAGVVTAGVGVGPIIEAIATAIHPTHIPKRYPAPEVKTRIQHFTSSSPGRSQFWIPYYSATYSQSPLHAQP
jgi:hypothetical protein